MADNTFFDETTEQSAVKTAIVSKYFWAWAKVIIPAAKQHGGMIAYIDLFAGPGRYKDGTASTPLLVLEKAIQDADMREMLVAIFNDKNTDNSRSLEVAVANLPGIETLKYPPQIDNEEVGEQIVKMFETRILPPALSFVDPWGYKGLSLRLVNSVLKDWGCDCIFFFNYNRINMGLGNPMVEEHMNSLFGKELADELRPMLEKLSVEERELLIVEKLTQALTKLGGKYVLPFRFRTARGSRTSHHLIFVSKHFRGYEIMKEIMAHESSSSQQDVPSFEYSPAGPKYPLLHALDRPLDELKDLLLSKFAGRRLTMKEVYELHSVGTPFIKGNYKKVLLELKQEGKVNTDPAKLRKGTFADHVKVGFPARGA